MEEAHNIDVVKEGFEDYWNIEKLHQHYDSLKKNRDGTIKVTHKGITFLFIFHQLNVLKHYSLFHFFSWRQCKTKRDEQKA